jgi:hypothetical protein
MNWHYVQADIAAAALPIRDKWRQMRPDWRDTDSPLKYVDWAMADTITKCRNLCTVLAPRAGDLVVELGPGACYLSYMLSRRGCTVKGYDLPERPLYRDCAAALGVDVEDCFITARNLPPFGGPLLDMIIATQISWMNAWTKIEAHIAVTFWKHSLRGGGRLVLFPNPQAIGGCDHGAVFGPVGGVELTMPMLGRGFVFTA